MRFQVLGLIEDIAVVDSQRVQEGDVIARLDRRDFQNQVVSARAQFENAEAMPKVFQYLTPFG
ncbi:MAG: biotin/lipoyl-binding protein [Proteobacteria bacterium]|nr:biotin/lipoyl-binding protein [Pseudomonadota bacterium]